MKCKTEVRNDNEMRRLTGIDQASLFHLVLISLSFTLIY